MRGTYKTDRCLDPLQEMADRSVISRNVYGSISLCNQLTVSLSSALLQPVSGVLSRNSDSLFKFDKYIALNTVFRNQIYTLHMKECSIIERSCSMRCMVPH